MKRLFTISLFIVLLSAVSSKAQTYIQGKNAIPFNTIGSVAELQNSTLLSIEQAYNKINSLRPNRTFKTEIKDYSGQYFLLNDMVIRVFLRKLPSVHPSPYKMLSDMKRSIDMNYVLFSDEYNSEVKKIKNYYAYTSYMTNENLSKNAVIIDDASRYMIFINIFSKNDTTKINEAISLLNNIVNDITFK